MTDSVTPKAASDGAAETVNASPLTASDRCDRCAAAAQVRATLPSGFELLFCGHHFAAHREKLAGQGAEVFSEVPVSV